MKYYGFAYMGNFYEYSLENATSYTDPYAALAQANREWDAVPEPHIGRLLIVLQVEDVSDANKNDKRAFFQFTSGKACLAFIKQESEIIWSSEANQLWNGNAEFMG
ncbi:MAG: hypothetical protein IJT78_02680 [Oscillospiraceae bacterium]|nr:hypothetical protein [Oscillospiraceae bacterium]